VQLAREERVSEAPAGLFARAEALAGGGGSLEGGEGWLVWGSCWNGSELNGDISIHTMVNVDYQWLSQDRIASPCAVLGGNCCGGQMACGREILVSAG
jgi:hypothetical protein